LDLRSRHYLRVSALTNLFTVDFRSLQTRPSDLLTLLQYAYPSVTLTVIGNGQYVTTDSLNKTINLIANSQIVNTIPPFSLGATVIAKNRTPLNQIGG
jgi:hypothetical protein